MPNLSKNEWEDLNRELTTILAPWHEQLAIATSQNISEINDLSTEDIRTFLISKPDLFLEQRHPNNNSRPGFISREPRTLLQLRNLKRALQK